MFTAPDDEKQRGDSCCQSPVTAQQSGINDENDKGI